MLLVEGEAKVCRAIGRWLAVERFNYAVTGSLDEARTTLQTREDWSVVLLEPVIPTHHGGVARMGAMSGFELIPDVRRGFPGVDVIVISTHGEVTKRTAEHHLLFIPKPCDPNILHAIVQDGVQRAHARRLLRMLPDMQEQARLAAPTPTLNESDLLDLTPRQREILVLWAEGLKRNECIEVLGFSPKTYDKHRQATLELLDLSDPRAAGRAVRALQQAAIGLQPWRKNPTLRHEPRIHEMFTGEDSPFTDGSDRRDKASFQQEEVRNEKHTHGCSCRVVGTRLGAVRRGGADL